MLGRRWPPPWLLACNSKDTNHTETLVCARLLSWNIPPTGCGNKHTASSSHDNSRLSLFTDKRKEIQKDITTLLLVSNSVAGLVSACCSGQLGLNWDRWFGFTIELHLAFRSRQSASSFTINTYSPSRNKLAQLFFFKDSAKHWMSTEIKMNPASLKQAIFDVLVWFCYQCEVTERIHQLTQPDCVLSAALDGSKAWLRYIWAIKHFLKRRYCYYYKERQQKRYCHPMLWAHHLSHSRAMTNQFLPLARSKLLQHKPWLNRDVLLYKKRV